MYVRKIAGQEKLSKIILSPSEVEMIKRLGFTPEQYVKEQLLKIAKKRRWKWYLNKEKNA